MKKMKKMYEAPKAEMIEMHMPVVLMGSVTSPDLTGGGDATGED